MNGRDDIETHLHLMTALKEPLNLPIETNSLLYQGMSGFSEAKIEEIKINILNETSSPKQVVSILIASAFQEAVEGEEAEYHAEFNRLDKEEFLQEV